MDILSALNHLAVFSIIWSAVHGILYAINKHVLL